MEVILSVGSVLNKGKGILAYYIAQGLLKNKILKYIISYDYTKNIANILRNKIVTIKFLKYLDMILGFTRSRFFF